MRARVSKTKIENDLDDLQSVIAALENSERYAEFFEAAACDLAKALADGGGVFFFGNGGSAADAQHLAAELVGRMSFDRKPLRGVALSTDTSILTAVGNDFGFDSVFARQVEALCSGADVLVGISTSGDSNNVVEALKVGRTLGCRTVALTGDVPNRCASISDIALSIPSTNTQLIQVLHIFVGQSLLQRVEEILGIVQESDK